MSKEKLLLGGAGGFGRMVAEQAMLQYDCAFVDARPNKSIRQNPHKHPDRSLRAVWIFTSAFLFGYVFLPVCI